MSTNETEAETLPIEIATEFWSSGGRAGHCVLFHDPNTDRIARWYVDSAQEANRVEALARAGRLPEGLTWFSVNDLLEDGAPPYDHATATGMYD